MLKIDLTIFISLLTMNIKKRYLHGLEAFEIRSNKS